MRQSGIWSSSVIVIYLFDLNILCFDIIAALLVGKTHNASTELNNPQSDMTSNTFNCLNL